MQPVVYSLMLVGLALMLFCTLKPELSPAVVIELIWFGAVWVLAFLSHCFVQCRQPGFIQKNYTKYDEAQVPPSVLEAVAKAKTVP